MKTLLFIAIDSNLDESAIVKRGEYSETGEIITHIGAVVPIISEGRKECIGLAKITRLTILESRTEIKFKKYGKISDSEAKAYYNLYRNNSSINNDSYDPDYGDDIVSGMFSKKTIKSKSNNDSIFDPYDFL